MTALFTRIACSKRDGIRFPADYNIKAEGTASRDLVVNLMHHDPVKRLGNGAAGPAGIKAHAYFSSIDWSELCKKSMRAPWVPPNPTGEPAHVSDLGVRGAS